MDIRRKLVKAARCLVPLFAVMVMIAGCGDNAPAGPDDTKQGAGTGQSQSGKKADLMTVTLYFSTKDASALVAEKREVVKNDHPARTAIEELIAGPKNPELVKVVPATAKLRDIKVKDHVAYVDFSESFVKDHWGGSTGEILTVSAVVNTLTEYPEIKSVQFMVEGKKLETLKGHLDLEDPMLRNEAIVKNR